MTLKLNFDTPFPRSERDHIIKSMRDLGFSYERIYQSGIYSYHRFYGRLPTISGSSECNVLFYDEESKRNLQSFKNVDFVDIYIFIERE